MRQKQKLSFFIESKRASWHKKQHSKHLPMIQHTEDDPNSKPLKRKQLIGIKKRNPERKGTKSKSKTIDSGEETTKNLEASTRWSRDGLLLVFIIMETRWSPHYIPLGTLPWHRSCQMFDELLQREVKREEKRREEKMAMRMRSRSIGVESWDEVNPLTSHPIISWKLQVSPSRINTLPVDQHRPFAPWLVGWRSLTLAFSLHLIIIISPHK